MRRYPHLGSLSKGWSFPTLGSPSTTSMPAPQIHFSLSAFANASESTTVPLPAFTSTLCFFILRRKSSLTRCRVLGPPGAKINSTSDSRPRASRSTARKDLSCGWCWLRSFSSRSFLYEVDEFGLEEYMQSVTPKGIKRARVACEIRPNPRKPTVREGETPEVLSWGPHNAKGAQMNFGHYAEN